MAEIDETGDVIAELRAKLQAEREKVARLREALVQMPVMLDECRARIEGLIAAYRDEAEGMSEYFGYHGGSHSDENCPQDDTCNCPETQKMRAAWERFGREIELACRRVDKIKAMRQALAETEPKK